MLGKPESQPTLNWTIPKIVAIPVAICSGPPLSSLQLSFLPCGSCPQYWLSLMPSWKADWANNSLYNEYDSLHLVSGTYSIWYLSSTSDLPLFVYFLKMKAKCKSCSRFYQPIFIILTFSWSASPSGYNHCHVIHIITCIILMSWKASRWHKVCKSNHLHEPY